MIDKGCNIFLVDHPCQFLADATLFPDDSGRQGLPHTHCTSALNWHDWSPRKDLNDQMTKSPRAPQDLTFFRNTTNRIRQKWERRLGSSEKGERSTECTSCEDVIRVLPLRQQNRVRTFCRQMTGYQNKQDFWPGLLQLSYNLKCLLSTILVPLLLHV